MKSYISPLCLYPLLGDNMLTAISVARDCGMVRAHEKVIIADAAPPQDFHPARITWRYSENPAQTINQVRPESHRVINKSASITCALR